MRVLSSPKVIPCVLGTRVFVARTEPKEYARAVKPEWKVSPEEFIRLLRAMHLSLYHPHHDEWWIRVQYDANASPPASSSRAPPVSDPSLLSAIDSLLSEAEQLRSKKGTSAF